ncbi:MAG: glycogen/starch synthase [Polyangiaceae bacterium]|nr:glycogen/starch synthase [Polyangiaceae bacterium]
MDILMVTAELAPYARFSDAAEAVGALSKTLRQIGHDVTVAVPRYPGFEAQGLLLARRLTPLLLARGVSVTVFDGQLASGVRLVLFDAPELATANGICGDGGVDAETEARRCACFAQAAAALVRQRSQQGTPFDVVHLHDWPGALVPLVLSRMEDLLVPTVLTVHDLTRQGRFSPAELGGLGLPADVAGEAGMALDGELCALKGGLLFADEVALVSGTVCDELRVDPRAGALVRFLEDRELAAAVIGNGIDYAIHNPATDPTLASRFDAEDPARRGLSKADLLRRFELDLDLTRPLVAVFVDERRGYAGDVVVEALPELLRLDVALVLVGALATDAAIEAERTRHPDRLGLQPLVDDVAQRRLFAGVDLVVFPFRAVTGGFPVLVAGRYGAVPVAHATGPAGERVVDADAELRTGTGFLFDEIEPRALTAAVARAVVAYHRPEWPSLVVRVMRQDSSWDRPARRYVQLYRQAIASKE